MADYTPQEGLLDLTNAKTILQGTEINQAYWSKKIDDYKEDLKIDRQERAQIYKKRKDFYEGNQGAYTNITGNIKDTKQKKGHNNHVVNYAGKTITKIAFGMANNPPNITVPGLDEADELESVRAQAVEDFIYETFNSRENRFWKKGYRRSVFGQATYGDIGIKTFIQNGKIRIVTHDDPSALMVSWNNYDTGEFDCVICEVYLTAEAIEEQYGIKVNKLAMAKGPDKSKQSSTGSWDSNEFGTKGVNTTGQANLPTGKNNVGKLCVTEYDSSSVYAIKIEGKLVQLILKDDEEYPKIKYWTIIGNVPNPPSPWSIADIDYLIDLQVELNDNNTRTADYLRVGGVQRYLAYNLSGFEGDQIKTGSGQVISVNSPDGSGRFEPLQTNINNFPADQYHNRIMGHLYDLGLPKVNYGASGADSGRSKAMDYQSSIDLTVFKRDAWELGLQDICEKIQVLGNYLLGDKVNWFTDQEGNFIVRNVEFDWNDILPVSAADKIVNVANKVNMIGLPIKQAFKELGYRNPDKLYEMLVQEMKDPNMMIIRSKMWQLTEGLMQAQNASMIQSQDEMPASAGANQSFPTLTSDQNTEGSKPMAQKGGTTSYSSAQGLIARTRQNMNAQGR